VYPMLGGNSAKKRAGDEGRTRDFLVGNETLYH
jgi:hypothetical protein